MNKYNKPKYYCEVHSCEFTGFTTLYCGKCEMEKEATPKVKNAVSTVPSLTQPHGTHLARITSSQGQTYTTIYGTAIPYMIYNATLERSIFQNLIHHLVRLYIPNDWGIASGFSRGDLVEFRDDAADIGKTVPTFTVGWFKRTKKP